MSDKMLYVETVSDTALNLVEDIVHLQVAKASIRNLKQVTNLENDQEAITRNEQYSIVNQITDAERKLKAVLRHNYLDGKKHNVYDSMRKRLKEELKKEGMVFHEDI